MLLHRPKLPLKQSPSSLRAVQGMENEGIMPPGLWTTIEIHSLLFQTNTTLMLTGENEGKRERETLLRDNHQGHIYIKTNS